MRQERIGWANGISFDTGTSRLIFDPTSGRSLGETWNVFVTHAHSDHTYGFTTHAKKHSTPETLRIYESLQNRQVKNSHTLKMGEAIRIDDVEVRVLDAGHMLGSCQFEVVTPEFTGVYTGDINCVETLTTQAAQVKQCDYLIIEATYGHPSYVFPKRSTIYADIIRWTTTELKEGENSNIPSILLRETPRPSSVVQRVHEGSRRLQPRYSPRQQRSCRERCPIRLLGLVYGRRQTGVESWRLHLCYHGVGAHAA